MEILLTPSQILKLNEIAHYNEKSFEELLVDTAASLFQNDEYHWAAIDRALVQADKEEFIDEVEMNVRVSSLLAH